MKMMMRKEDEKCKISQVLVIHNLIW